MKRSIRWVPARLGSLGQMTPVVEPAPSPAPEPMKGQGTVNPLVVGGLILAGVALVWVVMRDPEPDLTRSWE